MRRAPQRPDEEAMLHNSRNPAFVSAHTLAGVSRMPFSLFLLRAMAEEREEAHFIVFVVNIFFFSSNYVEMSG